MKICKVENCNNSEKYLHKGYCGKHYFQYRVYGKVYRTVYDPNEIIDKGDHCEMVLQNIKCEEVARTIFSKKWLPVIKKYKWGLGLNGYPQGRVNKKLICLHQLILGKKDSFEIDHINRNKLDNRDENLRFVTSSQNNMNMLPTKLNTSGHRGVNYNKQIKKWMARISFNKKNKRLGYYDNKEDAIKVRKKAEQKYFGEFAPLSLGVIEKLDLFIKLRN